jgi:hypothetical protein
MNQQLLSWSVWLALIGIGDQAVASTVDAQSCWILESSVGFEPVNDVMGAWAIDYGLSIQEMDYRSHAYHNRRMGVFVAVNPISNGEFIRVAAYSRDETAESKELFSTLETALFNSHVTGELVMTCEAKGVPSGKATFGRHPPFGQLEDA